ncbi:MAG: DNA repair protein RecO [Bacteroidales bacterium]|nr:DNA repair protein RecO [Bacteroidales bacterium]
MQILTEAIVLHLAKYSDKASILHLYTMDQGRLALMVHGLHSKTGKLTAGILEPLMHIEIEANLQPNRTIQTLKTAHLKYVPRQIRTDMNRRTVSMFIAEILYRTLRYPLSDPLLFQYLTNLIYQLDCTPNPENLHLQFLLNFMQYIGISPDLSGDEPWLDMQDGELTPIRPKHGQYFTEEETALLKSLETTEEILVSRTLRQALLHKLCQYYELHIADFRQPKSLQVLETLFD